MGRTARVFVSYRRQDTRHVAGRLADRLVEHFDVFMDMDTIEPGTDFTDVIRQAVENCDIFLSVIGASWTTVLGEQGQRRLDDSADWVVAETGVALQRGVPVIPVLVDGAEMPTRAELPPDLAALASRQAVTIRHESFTSDVNHLIPPSSAASSARRPPRRPPRVPPSSRLRTGAPPSSLHGAARPTERRPRVAGRRGDPAGEHPLARSRLSRRDPSTPGGHRPAP